MKAKINSTGEVKDLKRVKKNWYVDVEGNAYDTTEFKPYEEPEEQPQKEPHGEILGIIKSVFKDSKSDNRDYWRACRLSLVLKFIDIYQAPSTNMEEIITLADKYIERLKQYDL